MLINKYLLKVIIILILICPAAAAETASFNSTVFSVSREYAIQPTLILRIIQTESSFNPHAVSNCGARGLMQVTRSTWDWICHDYLQVDWDFDECAFDPEKNIRVGVRFLRWIKDYLDINDCQLCEDRELLLACYNAGPGAVRAYGFRVPPYPETVEYIRRICNSGNFNNPQSL